MKRLPRLRILSFLLFWGVVHLPAQNPAQNPTSNESLLIGPGDLLHLLVYDTPEMEQRARVTDAGTIPFNYLGNVKVGGLTPEQAAEEIDRQLVAAGIMRHPQVTLRVEAYATQNVSVMGEVQKPGVYEIDTPRKVVDALALAGGLTPMADRHITIQRFNDAKQKVDYYYSNAGRDALSEDPMVFPGDAVVVSKAAVVYVLGDVSKPGGYPINTNDSRVTVLQAVAMAGYANHTAAVSKSKLVRKTAAGVQEIDLPLGAMEKGKTADIALLPDDVVYVPFSFMRNIGVNGQGILASVTSAAIYPH
jgi:polysaccharide biosynthesis/export protein